jgi:hypothetical protein
MRVRSLLTALGINAVPAIGWFAGDWTAGTTLTLFWVETLVTSLLVAARIVIHRHLHPSKGHTDYQAPLTAGTTVRSHSSYLSAFLVPALGFALAHGVFLAVLLWLMNDKHLAPEARVDPRQLLVGLAGIAFFQSAGFGFDFVKMRERPFRWLEQLGQRSLGRIFVIHFTILSGMALVMFTGSSRDFFGVFIFLKTLFNCASVLPQWQPSSPPAWLSSLMDRIKDPKFRDTTFSEYWQESDANEIARLRRNDEAPS